MGSDMVLAPRQAWFGAITLASFLFCAIMLTHNVQNAHDKAVLRNFDTLLPRLSSEIAQSVGDHELISLSLVQKRTQQEPFVAKMQVYMPDGRPLLAESQDFDHMPNGLARYQEINTPDGNARVVLVAHTLSTAQIMREYWLAFFALLLSHIALWVVYGYFAHPTRDDLAYMTHKINSRVIEDAYVPIDDFAPKEPAHFGATWQGTHNNAHIDNSTHADSNASDIGNSNYTADNTHSTYNTANYSATNNTTHSAKNHANDHAKSVDGIAIVVAHIDPYQLIDTMTPAARAQYFATLKGGIEATFTSYDPNHNLSINIDEEGGCLFLGRTSVKHTAMLALCAQAVLSLAHKKRRQWEQFSLPLSFGICHSKDLVEMRRLLYTQPVGDFGIFALFLPSDTHPVRPKAISDFYTKSVLHGNNDKSARELLWLMPKDSEQQQRIDAVRRQVLDGTPKES